MCFFLREIVIIATILGILLHSMELVRMIENTIFASETPCTLKQLCTVTSASSEEIVSALDVLRNEFTVQRGGLILIEHEETYTFGTNPEASGVVGLLRKEDQAGELSRPALETLAVIAYRGPVTKPEIEQIRGVNCAVSLRNLLIAGLIEEKDCSNGEHTFAVSMDFLRHLGVSHLSQLPQYTHLNELLIDGKPAHDTPATPLNI